MPRRNERRSRGHADAGAPPGRAELVVVHGGAGTWTPARLATAMSGLSAAAQAGWADLAAEGPLAGAVTAVRALEDEVVFNAGHGAVLTAAGEVELDAAVMDGATRRVGAVAAVQGIANPVDAAKAVLVDGRHCLLAGAGAVELARRYGVRVDAGESLRRAARPARSPGDPQHDATGGDTVGAICRDAEGRVAVAASTGGVANKAPGRIGDAALCGAGFYADDRFGAACCTGAGEAFIRLVVAKRAVDLLGVGVDAAGAAGRVVAELTASGFGQGGVVVVGRDGPPAVAYSAPALPWVSRTAAGEQRGAAASRLAIAARPRPGCPLPPG